MTERKNLKKTIKSYILREVELNEVENVIKARINQYYFYQNDLERRERVYEYRFRSIFNSIEGLREYYENHLDGGEDLLNLLVEDGNERLKRRYSQFYHKIIN